MLKVSNLCFRYRRRGRDVLRNVNLELGRGEIGILLGKNGSGKTTLFKNILGLCAPMDGTILFEGEELVKMPGNARTSDFPDALRIYRLFFLCEAYQNA